MNRDTISKLRDALQRYDRHELTAVEVAYRVDNVLGAIDGRYELEHSTEIDAKMRSTFPEEEQPR